jgi:hypothetical protein
MSGSRAVPAIGPEMRAARRELAGASDQRVLDVLRFVDNLQDRGQADGLLAPLRDRLRALRPPRPMRFTRLMFQPLQAAIVDTAAWRPGHPSVPRSALAPMTAVVRQHLPAVAATVDRIIADPTVPEAQRVAAAGQLLWSPAAEALQGAEPPPSWRENGLPDTAYAALSCGAAMVLQNAWALVEMADPSVPDEEVNRALTGLLSAAEAEGATGWGMMLSVLLQRFPKADAPRRAASAMRADPAMRAAATTTMAAAWSWIEAATRNMGLGDPAEAASVVRRQIALLEALCLEPAHRKRATELQIALRTACAARFEAGVRDRLLAPLQTLTPAEISDAGVLDMLETDARGLRLLELESRRLGCGAAHDARLADAATAVAARADMAIVDRARLVEILRGPQAASAMQAATT